MRRGVRAEKGFASELNLFYENINLFVIFHNFDDKNIFEVSYFFCVFVA